jgi:hypothetical protein
MSDIYERSYNWLALWLLVIAIRDLLHLLSYWFGSPAVSGFERAADLAHYAGFVVLGVAIFSTLFGQTRFLWSVTGPKDLRQRSQLRPDDFAVAVITRAAVLSCFATFAVLLFLGAIADGRNLPGMLVIRLLSFLLAGTFSVSYFALSARANG